MRSLYFYVVGSIIPTAYFYSKALATTRK